jgi:hypothetical protein
MRAVRLLLLAFLAVLLILFVVRLFLGPFEGLIAVESPLNVQCLAAVCTTVLILWNGRRRAGDPSPPLTAAGWRRWMPPTLAAIAIALAFSKSLTIPFTSDDYTHLDLAHSFSWQRLTALLTASGADEFFRPAGYLYMATLGNWAGFEPARWHLAALTIHLANCLLVYSLARRMGWQVAAAVLACLVFGLHGSRPEAVVWMSAAFDLLSAAFVLGSLHLFLCYRGKRRLWMCCASLALMAVALCSKEVAFATPLLLILLLYWKGDDHSNRGPQGIGDPDRASGDSPPAATYRRGLWDLAPWFAVAGLLFCYRWYVVGGIGGYAAQSGDPEVFRLNFFAALKVPFYRLWGPLYFPINWSVEPETILTSFAAIAAAAYFGLALAGTERRRALGSVAFLLICALPALTQSLIGVDLEKSRLLYLPSVGFALLVGCALENLRGQALRASAGLAIVLFFWASLGHNLAIWSRVADLADRTCTEATGALTGAMPQVVVTGGLPGSIDGVYFFRNGFEECLEQRAGRDIQLTQVESGRSLSAPPREYLLLRWDPDAQRLLMTRPEPEPNVGDALPETEPAGR